MSRPVGWLKSTPRQEELQRSMIDSVVFDSAVYTDGQNRLDSLFSDTDGKKITYKELEK